jgi:hypothetical protein
VQIYAVPPAGTPEDHAGAFHRSLFVFVSPSGRAICLPGGVRVLRCQLPRTNPFYDEKPADELLPPELPPADRQRSLERDAWRVLQHERDLKGTMPAASGPPMLREWAIEVEPEHGSSEVLLSVAYVSKQMWKAVCELTWCHELAAFPGMFKYGLAL